MTPSRVRTTVLVSGSIVLIMLASACSSGKDKGDAPRTTHTAGKDSSTTIDSVTAKSSSTAARKKHAKKSGATSTTRRGSTARVPSGSGTTSETGGTIYVPLGDTNTSTPTPLTVNLPPTTAGHTPTTVCTPKPYDPTKAIDLSCSPGVTPAEQARAEQLIRDTLRDLPHWADPGTAFAEGYRSIGDGFTGDEHYVNWSYLSDGRILDTKHPESLMYDTRVSPKRLVAAMFTLEIGQTFANVPDIGGPLTQWHVHNDLCLADDPTDPLRKVVSSLTGVNGTCPAGTTKAGGVPMIHVWIVKNPCGPFASLEGIGGGQVPPGETRHCDTSHGST